MSQLPPLMIEKERTVCAQCGAALGMSVGEAGCLNCLLRAGLNDSPNETKPQHRFQHYQLCLQANGESARELGRGAMGITYLAKDRNLDSEVALKVINARYSGNPEARERFRREARAAAQLRHPNVASVFHFGETESGQCFYAMEWVEGETLEARVRRDGPLDVSDAIEIAAQIARALVAAEAQGLVHRDLKPSNIMLASGEPAEGLRVKVIDFGLARIAVNTETALPGRQFSGTPGFASPEQSHVDVRSDLTAALEIQPDAPSAHLNRAGVYLKQNKFQQAAADIEAVFKSNPDFGEAYLARAQLHERQHVYAEEVRDLEKAASLKSNVTYAALNGLAWLRATCPEAPFRDGKKAIADATQACELTAWNQGSTVDTLAAAYAENGQFETAANFQMYALTLPGISADDRDAAEKRVSLYQSRQPFRNHGPNE
ncbi:MAG: protein kinase domain-containing protein [Chthoniobacterales bacterium]